MMRRCPDTKAIDCPDCASKGPYNYIIEADRSFVGILDGEDGPQFVARCSGPSNIENAKRITACLNAFHGVALADVEKCHIKLSHH